MKQSSLHGSFPVCGRKKETKTSDSRHRSARTRSLFFIHFFFLCFGFGFAVMIWDFQFLTILIDSILVPHGGVPCPLAPCPQLPPVFFFVSFFLFGFPWEFVAWRIKLLLGRTLGAGRGPAILWSNMDLDTDCMSQVAWGGREKCLKRNFWS